MKCSLGISHFLEEISCLSHSIVFLYFFALIDEEGFLISPCYSLELCIQMGPLLLLLLLLLSCFSHIQLCPAGSTVPGILQARTLEWVAISFSNAWKWKVKVKLLSCVWLFTTPWTAASQAPPSMGFSRQEYWSGVPLPSPSNGCIFPLPLCFCFFSQLFVTPPQTATLLFRISFFGEKKRSVCHSLLQWATFCQNSPPWPHHLGWPYTAWLIVSLS